MNRCSICLRSVVTLIALAVVGFDALEGSEMERRRSAKDAPYAALLSKHLEPEYHHAFAKIDPEWPLPACANISRN